MDSKEINPLKNSVIMVRSTLVLLLAANEGEMNIIHSVLQISNELSCDYRKDVLSTILVYDNEKNQSNPEIQHYIQHELSKWSQSSPMYKQLIPCLPPLETTNKNMYEYIYWRGYGVCSLCHMKDETITLSQWKNGVRWMDPFTVASYPVCNK